MKKVVILSGPSGSGKSTWARKKYPDAIVCSADHFFTDEDTGEYQFNQSMIAVAHAECMERFLLFLGGENPVIVVDNTNIHAWERRNYEHAARLAGWEVELEFFTVETVQAIKTCARRNEHGVPIEVVAKMAIEHEYQCYGDGVSHHSVIRKGYGDPMKPVSSKRRKRNAQAKPIRDGLRKEVGRCELCDRTNGRFDVHEICRGVHRNAALDKRFALLVVCRLCHNELDSAEEWPEARQLAVLATRRPMDFDLKAYLELTNPRAMKRITIEEVIEWMPEGYLSKQEVAERFQVDRRSVQNWIELGLLPAMDASTVGASRPLYRIAVTDLIEFCQKRRVSQGAHNG